MDATEPNNVENSDMISAQHIDQKAPISRQTAETTVSFDLSVWKINLKGFFKRVTGGRS